MSQAPATPASMWLADKLDACVRFVVRLLAPVHFTCFRYDSGLRVAYERWWYQVQEWSYDASDRVMVEVGLKEAFDEHVNEWFIGLHVALKRT